MFPSQTHRQGFELIGTPIGVAKLSRRQLRLFMRIRFQRNSDLMDLKTILHRASRNIQSVPAKGILLAWPPAANGEMRFDEDFQTKA
jgi:hypothetical protein